MTSEHVAVASAPEGASATTRVAAALQQEKSSRDGLSSAEAAHRLAHRDWGDFAVVTGLLIYNATVGFWQDNKAANALAALKKGLALRARVKRDGNWDTINATDLVTGDVVEIAAG
jgi:H+-transporting ATPase